MPFPVLEPGTKGVRHGAQMRVESRQFFLALLRDEK